MDLSFPQPHDQSETPPTSSSPIELDGDDKWCFPEIPPPLSDDIAFLIKFGFEFDKLVEVEQRCRQFDLPAATVLLAKGVTTQDVYYRCMARNLGLEYCSNIPEDLRPLPLLNQPEKLHSLARVLPVPTAQTPIDLNFGPSNFNLAPDAGLFRLLRSHIKRAPRICRRIKVSSHELNLEHLIKRSSSALLAKAINGLSESLPEYSAKQAFTVRQALMLLLLLQSIIWLWSLFPIAVPVLLHLTALYLYVGRAGLRLSAWRHLWTAPKLENLETVADEELTFYSVLVALYDESGVVCELVSSLARLDWPPELLEVKLICEADDHETIAACEQAISKSTAPIFSIVKVPPSQPRTKPKALNYALPLCRGDYVVVYDAEDRPDPAQLKQAFVTFRDGRDDLACLQAPLVIDNHASGWLAHMFAIEYSALFDGLLPVMGRKSLPLPLGGSSNHFKRRTLVQIGAWDPHNVTEDADLGLRLARAGCRVEAISCATYETAPTDLQIWMRQRTRWFKGWYQTFLVHSRHPWRLKQDLGFHGLVSFLLMTLGLALSALANPFLFLALISIAAEVVTGNVPLWKFCILILDSVCIVTGYGVFVMLAVRTLKLRGSSSLRNGLWALPVYWLLMSVAAWRALWQLLRCPHKWEKTPHLRRRTETPADSGGLP